MPDDGERALRSRNFAVLTSLPVVITARGGRVFQLRDDIPASVLLRYRVLADITERWRVAQIDILARFEEEARAIAATRALPPAPVAEGVIPERTVAQGLAQQREDLELQQRMAESTRAALARVRREWEADVCHLCADCFRWTYPALTDEELFGAWDEAMWGWQGGVFSADEAVQLVELFMGLRGWASSPPPSAPAVMPSSTESSPANRAQRRAATRAGSR